MKLGIITQTNNKGQMVIPSEFRKALGITMNVPLNLTLRDKGIFVHPIISITGLNDSENSYSILLARTKGTWAEDKSKPKRHHRNLELVASKKRKHAW